MGAPILPLTTDSCGTAADPRNENVEAEIRWCDVGEHRKLILTSCRFLLDSIAAQASSAVAQTVNDIHQLQDMAELRGLEPPRRGPLTPEFPRSLPFLYALIDDTVERLIERSPAEIPGGAYRPTVHHDYSVRYFTFCGVKSASFGIYFRDWRTYHHSPCWFTLHYDDLRNDAMDMLLKEPFNAHLTHTGQGHTYTSRSICMAANTRPCWAR